MDLKLYIIISGYQTIAKQKLFETADRKEKMEIPVPYYLVDAGEEKILIDSGISAEGGTSGLSTVKDVIDPVKSLSEIGISPEDITHIIHTHLHFDHAANTKIFPKAKAIAQLAELRAALIPDKGTKHGYVERDLKHPQIQWEPITGMKSLLDGHILIIPTPGHTLGHQSVLVRLKEYKSVIIAGDVAPLEDNLKEEIPPGVATSSYEALCSIRSLKELAAFEDAEIWCGHDPEFYDKARKSPDFYK